MTAPLLPSIRARLTAWYAGAFALFELVFAVAGDGFVARATGARVDEDLRRTAGAITAALDAQQAEGVVPGVGVTTVIREFRLGDVAVAVLDGQTGAMAVAFEVPARVPDWRRRFMPPGPPDFRGVLATVTTPSTV